MAPEELRKSGIDVIGDVPWGMHFCQFYETKKDLADILVPYFKAGLEDNEFCMWVTADPLNVADARRVIRRAMPDFQKYVDKGQIEIIPYSDWYIHDGTFDSDRVLDGWVDKLNGALARGFAGLRLTGNTFWLEPANWASFTDYEAAVDGVIGNYKMIGLCTYSLEKCGAFELLDVISNHRFALIKRAGRWQTIESTRDRELRQALIKTEERYRTLFNGLNEGVAFHQIILDDRGEPVDYRFLDVNPAFKKLTGLSAEQTVGKTVKEVLPGIEDSWIKRYGKVALTGEDSVFENYTAPLNKWYEVYAYSPEKGYFVTLFMDVTARKKAQEAMESLASFPAENPNPVMRINGDGTVAFANQGSDLILRCWQCRVGLPLPAPYSEYVREALASGNMRREELEVDGHVFALTFAPVAQKGYVNIYGRDVTERRRAEDALRLKSEELTRSNEELEQFAYVASHDLQEPLRMISSYVQLLASRYKGKLDKDADDFIFYATDGAARMQRLINDLLAYSRVGRPGREFAPVNLESALARALGNLSVMVRDAGVAITHDPLPVAYGDGGQLTQVFQNLIDNAVKFRGDSTPQIHLSAEIRGHECICSVRDNGIGIAPEYIGRLFMLFQRLHTRREYSGTGIGLAICKRIVEGHGGRIWVESGPGAGSTFYFSLPMASQEVKND
jgi:PAS domain S-box-containing protein